jgi:hypothetical protein
MPSCLRIDATRDSVITRERINGGGGRHNVEGLSEKASKDGVKALDQGDAGAARDRPDTVGAALRNAFQAAVEEDVPQELLDLLRRLD